MESYFLLIIGIGLVLFGALILVKFPNKAGGKVTFLGVEISSAGAGLPLIVLGVVTMTLVATWSNNGLPSLSRPEVPPQSPIIPAPSFVPPPPPAPAREGVFIGASENRQIVVAIAIKGDRAAGYLCDGNKIEAWLEGTVTGDQVDLRGKTGAVLNGTLRGASFAGGAVTGNSELLQYYAEMAQKPAGLYEGKGNVDGVNNRIGWIVLPDGSQVGVRNVNGERSSAPRLDLGQMKADGLQIPVNSIDGDDDAVPGQ